MIRRLATAALLLTPSAGCAPDEPPKSTGPALVFPAKFTGFGTEPFWSVEIAGAVLAFSSADQPTKRQARIARSEEGGVLTLAGTLDGEPVRALIRPESCSDGMSDRTYPYALELRLGPRSLKGCAFP